MKYMGMHVSPGYIVSTNGIEVAPSLPDTEGFALIGLDRLDRLPIGGFTGHIDLSPVGVKPPDPDPQSERPDDGGEG
jgi:hypothetical protein